MNSMRSAFAAVAASIVGSAAFGQGVCGSWTTELSQAGANGTVQAMTPWDPDGAGPLPEWLVIAGTFTSVGGVQTGYVAGWDGSTWHAMGAGLTFGPNSIRKLLPVGSDLILVGGVRVDGTSVSAARYTGAVWQNMNSPGGAALDADSSGSEMVMVGNFTSRAGLNGLNIARWRPETGWTTFGNVGSARAVVFHAGAWYVSGVMGSNSPRVAVRASDGAAWESLKPLEDDSEWRSPPSALYSVAGELWAVGQLWVPNGAGDALRYENGEWVQRGEGLTAEVPGQGFVTGGVLYRVVNGVLDSLIRRGPNAWEPVAADLFTGSIGGVVLHGGALHVTAGTQTGGDGPSVLDGGVWHSVGNGLSGIPTAAVTWRGQAVLGGSLTRLDDQPLGGLIARDSSGWRALGDPLTTTNGSGPQGMVVHSDELIVCGALLNGSGVPLNRVAAWNGAAWRSIGDGLPVLISAVASDGTTLYCAGYASQDGTASGPWLTVWRYTGGSSWTRVGNAVATGGSIPLLGVGGGLLSVSGANSTYPPTTVTSRVNYIFDGSNWTSNAPPGNAQVGSYVAQGGSLMVAGNVNTGAGWNNLAVVTPAGLVARPFGFFASSTNATYASAYRDGLIVSGRFFTGERAVFVPQVGDGVALPNPGGVVRALADDGVEGFAVVYTDASEIRVSRLSCSCSAADVASVGGTRGGDGAVDVNDLIVFIDLFFEGNWRGDAGAVGGVPGSDGAFDNNDFVVYIDEFFAGCGA